MIRIAYVINYIVKNGPSSVVLNLIDNLNRLEYDIALITLFEGNNAKVVSALRNNGVTVYECGTLSRMKCLLGQSKEFSDVVEKGNSAHTWYNPGHSFFSSEYNCEMYYDTSQ